MTICAGRSWPASGVENLHFIHAIEAGTVGKQDPLVLHMAAQQGQVMVSHDVRTMPRHFREFTSTQSSPGLILVLQKLRTALAIEDLLLIGLASEAEEWVNRIAFLPL